MKSMRLLLILIPLLWGCTEKTYNTLPTEPPTPTRVLRSCTVDALDVVCTDKSTGPCSIVQWGVWQGNLPIDAEDGGCGETVTMTVPSPGRYTVTQQVISPESTDPVPGSDLQITVTG